MRRMDAKFSWKPYQIGKKKRKQREEEEEEGMEKNER